MTKIRKIARDTVRQALTNSNEYDASSMRISLTGVVSARKDADKTSKYDSMRYLVAHVDDIVTASGQLREGW
jgi:hypothetical protein